MRACALFPLCLPAPFFRGRNGGNYGHTYARFNFAPIYYTCSARSRPHYVLKRARKGSVIARKRVPLDALCSLRREHVNVGMCNRGSGTRLWLVGLGARSKLGQWGGVLEMLTSKFSGWRGWVSLVRWWMWMWMDVCFGDLFGIELVFWFWYFVFVVSDSDSFLWFSFMLWLQPVFF